ncbi:polymeric immunoglobulin receptor-like isoform X2 [Silurus meridionalis]|nr:polymeric immunoglobulin receptor-like isoform X2 [Silurus meridionalis]
MILLLIFILCMISDGGASKEVTGYSGGRVIIKCKYDTEYTQNLNYFCKDSWSNCSVATEDINKWVHFWGRFLLFDDTKSAEIRVMIRELSEEDPGKYQCGFVKSWGTNICTPVKLDMQQDVQEVLSKCVQAGEDLEFSCKYTKKIKKVCKFICTMQQEHSCSSILSGQLSSHNDTEGLALSVSIGKLHDQDSGKYWGGAEGFFTIIILAVDESLSSPTAVETSSVLPSTNPAPTSTEGGESDAHHTYANSINFESGHLCMISMSVTVTVFFPGLLTLIVVSVLVMLFLIGISVHSLILQIGHRIKDGGASEEVTGYSGGGVLINCKYDAEYSQKQKIFCKGSWPNCTVQVKTRAKGYQLTGRFSMFDDTKSAEIRVMMRELTVEDAGTYHCGVIIRFRNSSYKLLSVELKVKEALISSLLICTVALCSQAPLDVCHYEDINNIRRLHAPNPGASTVYSFTKFSIIPCDSSQTVYANMLSHTGSHESISATPQLSKDLFDEDIYSTAQLPTCHSDTSVD